MFTHDYTCHHEYRYIGPTQLAAEVHKCPKEKRDYRWSYLAGSPLSAVEGYPEKVYVNVHAQLVIGNVENLDLPDMNNCQYIIIGKRFTSSIGNYYLGNISGCKYSHDRHGHFMIHSRMRNEKFKIPSGKDVTFTLWSEVRKTKRRVIVTDNNDVLMLQTKPTNLGDTSKYFSRFGIYADSLLYVNSSQYPHYLFNMELSFFDRTCILRLKPDPLASLRIYPNGKVSWNIVQNHYARVQVSGTPPNLDVRFK
jgi:hypothetical protein